MVSAAAAATLAAGSQLGALLLHISRFRAGKTNGELNRTDS